MGYADYDTVAMTWIDRVLGRTTRNLPKNPRMYANYKGDELYSYGSHFTLVQALRDKKGVVIGFLLNGDNYSVTTRKHQSVVRNAVARTGYPSVIIPFEALAAADIDRNTVEIVNVLPDRWVTTHRTYTEVQDAWRWRDIPTYAYRDQTAEELQVRIDRKNTDRKQTHEWHVKWATENTRDYNPWAEYLPGGSQHEFTPTTVDDLGHWDRQQIRYVSHTTRTLFASHTTQAPEVEITYVGGEPIEYAVETRRHWLGESLIRAKVNSTRRVKCPECGGTGFPRPNFGRLSRFGEVTYIEEGCGDCNAYTYKRGTGSIVKHFKRTATFLSGFDHNERREVYFFSEMPDNKSRTVEEAYEALKPDTVKLAEQMGREVARQGDIFAVPMPEMTKRDLTKQGARFEKRGVLLGTNHVATEVAYLPSGQTLARGTMTHDPGGRAPDHARCTLAKGVWHLVAKNTVPLTK